MKQLILGLLALGAVACQQSKKPASQAAPVVAPDAPFPAVTATTHNASVTAPDTARAETLPAPGVELTRQPLTAAAATALLARHDLADFWMGKSFGREEPPLDGFFGDKYECISFMFTQMQRDSLQPGIYHVAGKTRFHKAVTPFAGEVSITAVARLRPAQGRVEEWGILDADSTSRVYTARASFVFQEAANAGKFTGTAFLDFYLTGKQPAQAAVTMGKESALPAKGTGVLYKGLWTSHRSSLKRSLLLSADPFMTAPAALANFGLGDREMTFNPKYAKLGWNNYWANDEWWADSPKPKLSL